MNKLLLSAALIASTGLLATVPSAAQAADGQINFTGQVVAQTCTVNGTAFGKQATLPTVALPWVLAPTLATAGAVAGATPFAINITKCDSALKSVATQFSGGNINTATNNLSVTGGATNVELQLLNASDSSAVLLGQATASAQNSKPANLDSTGAATLNYIAQYKSLGGATAGPVTSSVQFTMIYQ